MIKTILAVVGAAALLALAFLAGGAFMGGKPSAKVAGEPEHRAFVRQRMIDPASALFGDDDFQSPRDPKVWCGSVNGRNKFGGMTGSKRYIAFLRDGDISLEGETPAIGLTGSGADVFRGRWKVFCE